MSRNKALSHAQGEYIAFVIAMTFGKKINLKCRSILEKKNIDFEFFTS